MTIQGRPVGRLRGPKVGPRPGEGIPVAPFPRLFFGNKRFRAVHGYREPPRRNFDRKSTDFVHRILARKVKENGNIVFHDTRIFHWFSRPRFVSHSTIPRIVARVWYVCRRSRRGNSSKGFNTREISNFALSSNQGNPSPRRKKCNFGVESSVGADVPQNLVARSSREYNDCGLRNSAGS